VANFQFTS